jgi:two-component system, NarL family, invasion response regulator UvrY
MGTIPVGVIEDHPLYRTALAQVLGGEPDLELDGVAESVERFRASRRRPGGVVVLDLELGEMSGTAAVRAVTGMGHRVLVVSAHASRGDVFGAIAAGAHGFLCKDADGAEILRAVRLIATGKGYASPALVRLLPRYREIGTRAVRSYVDWLRGRRRPGLTEFASPA